MYVCVLMCIYYIYIHKRVWVWVCVYRERQRQRERHTGEKGETEYSFLKIKIKLCLTLWQQWDPTGYITRGSIYFKMFAELNLIRTGFASHKRLGCHWSGESQCFLEIQKFCNIYPSGNSILIPWISTYSSYNLHWFLTPVLHGPNRWPLFAMTVHTPLRGKKRLLVSFCFFLITHSV